MQGSEMKDARRVLGLTQDKFAEALGMSRKAINQMEVGKASIDLRTDLATRYLLTVAGKRVDAVLGEPVRNLIDYV